ncbi:MAG: hypothetical protein M3083_12275 [Actinomycetota bacterium]|nr:hypothetical protein [Actinomycetota bacterium]
MHPTAIAAAQQLAATHGASHLAWVLATGLVALLAVIRVLRQPAGHWKYRNWSKLAWVIAILYLAPALGGYAIPIAAMAAIARTRTQPGLLSTRSQLPEGEGTSDWPLPWGSK